MKRLLLTPALLAVSLVVAQGEVGEQLRAELLEMGRRDQEVRDVLVPLLSQQTETSADDLSSVFEQMNEIDEANFQRLEEIIEKHGWPGKSLVGEEASNVARMLIQHSTLERQKRYLPMLQAAAAEGEVDSWGIAMLEDRIRIREGHDQLYGANFELTPGGGCAVTPIEDSKNVDLRRAAVGLPPMEEYIREVERNLEVECSISSRETQ